MKLSDRQTVEGTIPTIYIGHRVYAKGPTESYTSKTWYAEWAQGGRTRAEALGTRNKQAAIRKAHEVSRRLVSGEAKPAKPVDHQIRATVEQYLLTKAQQGLAPKSLTKYTQVLTEFAAWCETRQTSSLLTFGERNFWAYKQSMSDAGHSEARCFSHLLIIKIFFKWTAKIGILSVNKLSGISLVKPPGRQQPCFTAGQIAKILEHAHPREAAIYACMAYTGMRFGEVRDLTWSDVLWDAGRNGFIVIRRGGSRPDRTKNSRLRRMPLHGDLKPYLAKLPRTYDRVFTARESSKFLQGGGPLSERRLIRSLKGLCGRLKFAEPKQYKLHTFRHSFASMCARTNIAYKYALEWMGHQSSEILDLYYQMFDDVAEEAMSSIRYTSSERNQAVG